MSIIQKSCNGRDLLRFLQLSYFEVRNVLVRQDFVLVLTNLNKKYINLSDLLEYVLYCHLKTILKKQNTDGQLKGLLLLTITLLTFKAKSYSSSYATDVEY